MRPAPARPLRFACRCSRARVVDMLTGLSVTELSEMARQPKATSIYCHMCGKGYDVTPEELKQLVEKRKQG